MNKLLSLVLALVLLASYVSGLGVTPSRVVLRYEPNAEYVGGACFKTYGIDSLKIDKDGDFAGNIEFIGLDPSGMLDASVNPCVQYKLKLPATVGRPGVHYTRVTALEVPDETQGNIFAVVRIEHQIWVDVPYPGKYLEIQSLNAENSKAGSVVPIIINVQSKGIEPIGGATGSIDIYDKNRNKLATIPTTTLGAIASGESKTMTARWNSSGNIEGNYLADLTIMYDSLKVNRTSAFKLGGLDISVIDYTKEVYVGGIRPFYVGADSIWSEPIPNVKALVEVYKDGELKTSFETLTRTVQAWSTEYLPGFVDTDALGLGVFDLKINLSYENVSKMYDGQLNVTEKPVPSTTADKKPFVSTPVLLAGIGIAILIVIGILIFALVPKKKKEVLNKEKPGKDPDERAG